ncbi:Ferredoxin-thioredoxin reductase, catalytic chain [Quillaja saponaria]|uniref:Ferredoxin-thioredoxin reductase catalytic chain, chloroplastic n=1 Tax=Quillaja saponaria TaxID=32244 RepID=A0AAD7PXA6_QUISA|nr:Ferredoxin-thioredoxin reductase, catalytic chain [Quillaja saponaria]
MLEFKQGLVDHKDSVGAPLCPCRHYDDKAAEVGQGFWNCPCVPMRESLNKEEVTDFEDMYLSFLVDQVILHMEELQRW